MAPVMSGIPDMTVSAMEATQGQKDGSFSPLPYKCHLEEVASVGDYLKICPQFDSRVVHVPSSLDCGQGLWFSGADSNTIVKPRTRSRTCLTLEMKLHFHYPLIAPL